LIRLNIVKSTLVSICRVFCGPSACECLKLSLVCTCLVNEILCLPLHAVQLPPRRRSYVCIICVYVRNICIFVCVSVCACVFSLSRFGEIQDAQLSQRDRAAGCIIIVFTKSRRLQLGDNILRAV